ncbi:MAG: hypothetical protein WCC90_22455 [Methylocella sp.]
MSTEIKHFRVPHHRSLKLAEAAEANVWRDDNFSQSTVTIAAITEIAARNIDWTEVADQAAAAAFESAERNIWMEVAGQAAAAGSAALSVTIPRPDHNNTTTITIPRPASPRTEPPRVVELLVGWCIKKRYRKALLDDLDEVFQCDLSNGMTVARARLRYWGSALHSITPQLLALAKRIGIFGLIADYARRLLH